MRAIAGSILILAAVQFHQSPAARLPLGVCLLTLMAVTGVGFLISDLAKPMQSPLVRAVLNRVLAGENFLIKGTIVGALAGLLVNFAALGGTRVGNLAAIPGAAIGLALGVALDAVAHRRKHRTSPAPISTTVESPFDEPLPEHRSSSLVEARSWDLSSGTPQHVPHWPDDSNPMERQ